MDLNIKTDFKKKLLPHLFAIIGFIIIASIYFYPVLEGKSLRQHDIVMAKSMQQEIQKYYKETGELTLWTNSIFGGMPAYQIWVRYPSNFASYLIYYIRLGLPETIGYVFLYFICFYIFMLVLRIKPTLAFIGGIAFAFGSYNFINIEAGHVTKAMAVAFMPLTLAGVVLSLRGKYFAGFALTAAAMALEIRANHLQITYYLALMIGVLLVTELIFLIKEKKIMQFVKAGAVMIAAVLLGVAMNITSLLTTQEYTQYTMRGGSDLSAKKTEGTGLEKDYALSWSYGVGESFTIMIPYFRGGASVQSLGTSSNVYKEMIDKGVPRSSAKKYVKEMPLYWGSMRSTSGPIYMGASVVFLFVLGMFLLKNRLKWWILIVTVMALMLSWGENFLPLTNLFFNYFPLYNKFRVPMTLLLVVGVCLPIIASLVMEEISEKKYSQEEILKALKYTVYGLGGLTLFFLVFGPALFSFQTDGDASMFGKDNAWILDPLKADRIRLFRLDALRSLFFMLVIAGAIWFYFKNKLKPAYMMGIVGLVILIDLWTVDQRYFNNDDFKRNKKSNKDIVEKTPADEKILMDKDPDYRVLNLTSFSPNYPIGPWNDAAPAYYHKSVGGYHGAKMSRYQDMIDSFEVNEASFVYQMITKYGQIEPSYTPVYNMLNTKYYIMSTDENGVFENPGRLGNAWFVKEYKLVKNADEEIKSMRGFNPAFLAIIDKKFEKELGGLKIIPDSGAWIKLDSYKPNKLEYSYRAVTDQLAVFSEIYYEKGWKVTIDGKPASHFRANYILRAMKLPAGEHKIVFEFKPEVYYRGEKISLASSILLVLITLAGGFMMLRRKPSLTPED